MKNKVLEKYSKYCYSRWFSLLVNFVALTLLLFMEHPVNVTDDNLKIINTCNGSYGISDIRLVYCNCILGAILKGLYIIFPRVQWFDVISLLVVLFSLSAITFVLIRIMGNRLGIVGAALLFFFYGPQTYIRVQYTKTSGVATAAGILIILYYSLSAIQKNNRFDDVIYNKSNLLYKANMGDLWIGIILSVFGIILRFEQFAAVVILMFPAIIYCFIVGHKRRLICSLALLMIIGGICQEIDICAYNSDENWRYYKEINQCRTELFDYNMPDYEENADVLNDAGITKSAYELFRDYNYADPEVFDINTFRLIASLNGKRSRISGTTIKAFLKEFPFDFFEIPEFYVALIFLVMLILYGNKNKLTIMLAMSEIVLFGSMYFYLFYRGRYLYERVDMGLLLAVSLVFAMLFNSVSEVSRLNITFSKRYTLLLLFVMMIFSQVFFRENWRHYSNYKEGIANGQSAKIDEMSNDKSHLYLCKRAYPDVINAYEPFDVISKNEFSNIYWLGGWETFEPVTKKPLENYNVTNPYREMINNESVYIVDDDIELTLNFLHDYYDPKAKAVEVKMIGDEYHVYKIVS